MTRDPYHVFFPLGIFFGLAGVAVWPLYSFGLTIGAPFAPKTYFDHLMWAALLWMAGMIVWGGYIVRSIRKAAPRQHL